MNLFGKESRPVFNDKMKIELCEIIGQEIYDWYKGDATLKDCISETKEVLEFHDDCNGYEIAREFESIGYIPDLELVEILDSISDIKSNILRNKIKKWVISDSIEPSIEIGIKCMVINV
jgi:hypothetical protein